MPDPVLDTGQSAPVTVPDAGGAPPVLPTDGAWFDTLPDGLRGEKSLEAFKGKPVSAIVESYISAHKSFGSRLPVPLPTDKPEDRAAKLAAIQGALGRPASHDKYVIQDPAYATMGLQKNEASLQSFLKAAHVAGLTNDQAQALVNWQANDATASAPDHAKAAEQCVEALTKGDENAPGWGSTFPKYVAIAKRAVDSQFPVEVQKALESAGFYNNPGFIRGMYAIGKELIEDNIIMGDEVDTTGHGTSAQKELDAIMADVKGPYFDGRHPRHDEFVDRALDLRRFLNP